MQDLQDERVLISGFSPELREAMMRADIPVVAAVEYAAEYVQDPDLAARAEIVDYVAMVHGNVGPNWDPTIPTDLIAQIFDAAYMLYLRAHGRLRQAPPDNEYSWLNTDNQLHRMIHWCVGLIRRHDISRAIFHNLPHEGAYVVLYEACKAMGIPTLVCNQSIFANRIWLMNGSEDFGTFPPLPGCGGPPEALPPKPEVPFYMQNVPSTNTETKAKRQMWREMAKLALKRAALVPLIKPRAVEKNLGRIDEYRRRLKLTRRMADHYGKSDLDRPYIYFPLHLQPEMTTDTLGGIYADQLRALEELCAAVPDDMIVYVKENPKQGVFMREPSFFDRLAAISNAVYLPVTVPTFDLIEHSRAVATITGSAGWEAMIMGRPAITFGNAWYNPLPGAHLWQGPETLHQALAYQHDRPALEAAFADLTRRLAMGIVDPYFGRMIDDFDSTASARETAQTLVQALAGQSQLLASTSQTSQVG